MRAHTSDRSLDTKMISKSGRFGETFLYQSANFGVKPRQGGHQWAEKYSQRQRAHS